MFNDVPLIIQAGVCIIFSFFLGLFIFPKFINYLNKSKLFNPIRDELDKMHDTKKQTPSLGGLVILFTLSIVSLIFGDMSNPIIWTVLSAIWLFAIVGFCDDIGKIKSKDSQKGGLTPKFRLMLEGIITLIIVYILANIIGEERVFSLSFSSDITIDLGWFYFVFAYILIVGSANAYNITDGLDSLAAKVGLTILIGIAILSYFSSDESLAQKLSLSYNPLASDVLIISSSIIGALTSFLLFNTKPARIFMGDTGSLAIGSCMAFLVMLLKMEIIFAFLSFVLILEVMSSMIQTVYFKLTKKVYGEGIRIFKMAPLHHHFEKSGYSETRVVNIFTAISTISVIVGIIIAMAFFN